MIDVGVLFQQAAAALRRERHATYRLQLGSTLGFDAVAALGPYLDALGVSDAYLSPCFRCGPGSSHGYDVTDHNAFNPEIGGAAAFDRLAAALTARGLGLILDVVPNHMGIAGDANPWWLDVLENGQASPRAGFFDIDWTPIKPELRDRVLLPVLPGSVRPRARVAAAPARVRGRRLPPALRGRAPADRPRHLRADPDRPPRRARGPPRARGRGAPGAAQHPDLARAPARAHRDRSRPARGAAAREGDRQAPPRRSHQGVGGDSRARRGDGARHERHPGRSGELRRARSPALGPDLPPGRLARGGRRGELPPLLRREPPGGHPHGGALRVRRRPRAGLPARRRGQGRPRCAWTIRTGSTRPGEYFRRLQEGALVATARRLLPELGPAEAEALGALYRARAPSSRPRRTPGRSGSRPRRS